MPVVIHLRGTGVNVRVRLLPAAEPSTETGQQVPASSPLTRWVRTRSQVGSTILGSRGPPEIGHREKITDNPLYTEKPPPGPRLPNAPADSRMRRMSETVLDVKGMACPLPVLRANRSLRGMASGERLRVLATDRAAVADFQAFCRETGHDLLAWSEEAGVFSFVIRRRPEDRDPKDP